MPSLEIPAFRVDMQPTQEDQINEHVGRVLELTPTGCVIHSTYHPNPGAILASRLCLPGTDWPLAVGQAQVTWGHWDSFSVEF